MFFRLKPDYEQSKERYDAFWERAIIDRPPVSIVLPADHMKAIPGKEYLNQAERWLDTDFRAELAAAQMENLIFYADALPVAWPDMGPGIFSAWSGCRYEFGEATAWTEPCIKDWEEDNENACFNPRHPLLLATIEYTEKLIELGKGNFITGLTDFHPGGDHLAALRGSDTLAMDLLECPDIVKEKLLGAQKEYFEVYDFFCNMLSGNGLPITAWIPLVHNGKYYIPSNDFSCMIGNKMFQEFFLPGIIEECRHYERSIYHLDGPGALRHLDSILGIKELDAVQWVPGAGNEGYGKWISVYQRIQSAGKSIQLESVKPNELPLIFETLKPEGVWFSSFVGIQDKKTADEVLKRISAWR